MAKPLVSDALWAIVEPLLPKPGPKKKDGRPRIPDRACLTGILFVLRTGIPWEYLPQEMGCGSGMTCWRRLEEWQGRGGWQGGAEPVGAGGEEGGVSDWGGAGDGPLHLRGVGGGPQPGAAPP